MIVGRQPSRPGGAATGATGATPPLPAPHRASSHGGPRRRGWVGRRRPHPYNYSTPRPRLPSLHQRPSIAQEGADHRRSFFVVVFLPVSAVTCLSAPRTKRGGGGTRCRCSRNRRAAAWIGRSISTGALNGGRQAPPPWSEGTSLAGGAGVNALLAAEELGGLCCRRGRRCGCRRRRHGHPCRRPLR